MEPVIRIIQAISVLVQFTAVLLALRLIPITKTKKAWVAISTAIFLMAIRRSISLMGVDHPGHTSSLLWFEIFGLIISIFMVYGVAYIAPVFLELKRSEKALEEARDQLEKRVEERTIDLAKANESLHAEIVERKQVEEMLRLDDARLEALWQLSQMVGAPTDQIAAFALEQQIKLTTSKIGWIGFIGDDEKARPSDIWSKSILEGRHAVDKPPKIPDEIAGLWMEAARDKRVIVINDFPHSSSREIGCREAGAPLTRLMLVPVLDGDRTAAVAAVANKEEEYNASDARQLTLLMDGMWKLRQREKAEKALRESERLAAIGRAMSAVAHDMKTPLIAIGGFSILAQKLIEKGSSAYAKLDIVIKETRRLEKMVKDVLDFSRPLELKITQEDIRELMAECLAVAEPLAQARNIALWSRAVDDIPRVSMDGLRMKQALINLITNAIEASPDGADVTISVRTAESRLQIEVMDCGCGIPPEKRQEIFSPFFTTKKEGTGLGLAIVKKIVEAHKGSIEILDNPQIGVTFRVLMPLKSGSEETKADDASGCRLG